MNTHKINPLIKTTFVSKVSIEGVKVT